MTGQAAQAGSVATRAGDGSAWTRASLREDLRESERKDADTQRQTRAAALAPEPVVCAKRRGTTPSHPEPGRETRQRRWYWRNVRWESRSVHPTSNEC